MPLSGADFSKSNPVIGSVKAAGSVELRGVQISREGTLFAGDTIRTRTDGYARLVLSSGDKIEVAQNTDVNVNRDAQGVQIAMNTGVLGFAAHSPLRIDVLPYEVVASDNASGNVVIGSTTAGIRAIDGKLIVRNRKTSESFVLSKGEERFFALPGGVRSPALAQVASAAPPPVPAPGQAGQTPAGKTSTGGIAMDSGAWVAVIGGAALAAISITALVKSLQNSSDIDDLQASPSRPR